MTEYKNKLSGFAERLKSEEITAPIQQVTPVKASKKTIPEKEVQLNIYVSTSLLRKVKVQAIECDRTLKEYVTAALVSYLTIPNHK